MPTNRKSCWNALLSAVWLFFAFFFRFATDSSMLEENKSKMAQVNKQNSFKCKDYIIFQLPYLSQACLCSGLKGWLLWTCFGWLSRACAY